MSIVALIAEARADLLDDEVAPYLWSDGQLTRFANEAVLEACQRSPLLTGTSTVAVLVATADYVINSSIKQINVAKLNLATYPLQQTTDAELSMRIGTNWRTRTGTPSHYVRRGHKLTLFPIPLVADTLALVTSNLPGTGFDLDLDLDPAYHKSLLFYVAYKAFMKPDADTYNPVKAADFLKMFEARFGTGHTAKYNAAVYDNPMYGTVTSGRMC